MSAGLELLIDLSPHLQPEGSGRGGAVWGGGEEQWGRGGERGKRGEAAESQQDAVSGAPCRPGRNSVQLTRSSPHVQDGP